jgi:biotin carboxyl carrier protein
MAKYEVTVDGKKYEVEILLDDGRHAVLKVNDRQYEVDLQNVSVGLPPASAPTPQASIPQNTVPNTSVPLRPATPAPNRAATPAAPGDMQIRAPMPGLVLEVLVSVGQRVKPGDVLLRVEAMKMENDIKSHAEGTVREIFVAQGNEVLEGDVLMVLEE